MSHDTSLTYDVVMVSDLRSPGGTSSSLAEEIACQASAGYSTALVHVPRHTARRLRPINAKLQYCIRRGLADLVYGQQRVHGRLLVIRHPAIFDRVPEHLPAVSGEQKVLVANQAPVDASTDVPYYDVERVQANVTELFGAGFVWAPIGPLVRDSVVDSSNDVPLLDWDWVNTVDVEEWATARPPLRGRRPVIGRHSRPHFRKWPATADEVLAAYPDSDEFEVQILGGADEARQILGRIPESWTVHPFGSMSTKRFLGRLDFFVYFHHPGLVEAFGRAPLEALASGAVTILPEHFRRVFGEACLYGTPQDVPDLVRSFARDSEAYELQARRGQEVVRREFGAHVPAERIRSFIGPPSTARAMPSIPKSSRPSSHGSQAAERVLFVSSNGAGMGHLTRLLAMARRARNDVQPVFFTASQAVAPVRSAGFPCEYIPARAYLGSPTGLWNRFLHERLNETLRTYQVRAVVFDGTWPFPGLLRSRAEHPDIPFVWSRRAMWQAGGSTWPLDQADAFDLVIEPGELAAPYDHGPTVPLRSSATMVEPITVLDDEELLTAEEAKSALDLDQDKPAVLVSLGAGNINDIAPVADAVVEAFAGFEHLQVCVTSPAIADRHTSMPQGVRTVTVHPLSRYLRAFEMAVSAAGYNSFHELIRFRVPTLFIPNTATTLDDQVARARYAHDQGLGLWVAETSQTRAAAESLLREDTRRAIRERCAETEVGNGAREAMHAVQELAVPWHPTAASA